MKYCLIGPYPPPLGGVSVYVYRYGKELTKAGHTVEILDFSKLPRWKQVFVLLRFMFHAKATMFILTEFRFPVMAALLLRLCPGKVVFQDHSYRLLENLRGWRATVLRKFLQKVDACILFGAHLKDYYRKCGYRLPDNTSVGSAFLPPPLEEEPAILATYGKETLAFLAKHRPLVIANAFDLVFYQGIDLYGLDLCVELTARLKQVYPQVGVLFAIARITNEEYFTKVKKNIENMGLADHFHFVTGNRQIWPLFRKMDVMVRPTNSDGYAVSIPEAQYLGCTAVASDVCARPPGSLLFRNRDLEDFQAKVIAAIEQRKARAE
jgi:glycosyltransferase involved in cell wall biosynthesis